MVLTVEEMNIWHGGRLSGKCQPSQTPREALIRFKDTENLGHFRLRLYDLNYDFIRIKQSQLDIPFSELIKDPYFIVVDLIARQPGSG